MKTEKWFETSKTRIIMIPMLLVEYFPDDRCLLVCFEFLNM